MESTPKQRRSLAAVVLLSLSLGFLLGLTVGVQLLAGVATRDLERAAELMQEVYELRKIIHGDRFNPAAGKPATDSP